MPSLYDLMKYAKTGIASPDMTDFDKRRSLAAFGRYPVTTITGVPPLNFKADGSALTDILIGGNMEQSETPSTTNPIYPQELGDLVASGEHSGEYAIPITCGNSTSNIYLQEPIRKIGDYADKVGMSIGGADLRIKKMVLKGTEDFYAGFYGKDTAYFILVIGALNTYIGDTIICSHFQYANIASSSTNIGCDVINSSTNEDRLAIRPPNAATMTENDFKQWIADQYSAGTPVTIWIVRSSPLTETVTIPAITTEKGSNTLSVGTTLQPSSVSATGHIKQ